jgi:hypothetical protein
VEHEELGEQEVAVIALVRVFLPSAAAADGTFVSKPCQLASSRTISRLTTMPTAPLAM